MFMNTVKALLTPLTCSRSSCPLKASTRYSGTERDGSSALKGAGAKRCTKIKYRTPKPASCLPTREVLPLTADAITDSSRSTRPGSAVTARSTIVTLSPDVTPQAIAVLPAAPGVVVPAAPPATEVLASSFKL